MYRLEGAAHAKRFLDVVLVHSTVDAHPGFHQEFKCVARVVYENFSTFINQVLAIVDSHTIEYQLVYFTNSRNFSDGLTENILVNIFLGKAQVRDAIGFVHT